MNKKIYLLLIVVLAAGLGMPLLAGGSQESEPVVDEQNQSVLLADNWEFSWEISGSEIEFTLSAPTTGWVAIGFNPSTMMKDADYRIAYVEGTDVFIRDDFGNRLTSHVSDEQLGGAQHVRVISGFESDGVTTVVFAMPLDAGDEYDESFVSGQEYKVILAYASNGGDDFTSRHVERTSVEIVL
jgi:hypothetical protein